MCMCDLSWMHILNWNINMKHATCLVKIWTENMLNMVHCFFVAAMLVSFYWFWISSKHQHDEKFDLVYKFLVLCYVLSIKWLVLSFLSNLNVLITVKWLLMFFFLSNLSNGIDSYWLYSILGCHENCKGWNTRRTLRT